MANRSMQANHQGTLILLILLTFLLSPAKACTPAEYRDLAGWKSELAARRAKLDEARPLIIEAKARAKVFRDTAASARRAGAFVDLVIGLKEMYEELIKIGFIRDAKTDLAARVLEQSVSEQRLTTARRLSDALVRETLEIVEGFEDLPTSPGDVLALVAEGGFDWLDQRSFKYANDLEATMFAELAVLNQAADWIREYEGYCAEEEAEARQTQQRPPQTTPVTPPANSKPVDLSVLDRMAGTQSGGIYGPRRALPMATAPSGPSSAIAPVQAAPDKQPATEPPRQVVRPRLPPPRPESSQIDLGALDRMVPAAPPASMQQPGRPLSQDAYLAACLGKESSAECHRVHCQHVGAALNDPKWTRECLDKR